MAIYINGSEVLTLSIDDQNIETVNLDGVTLARKPTITTQPVGGTITDEESTTLSVAADGLESTMSYQWYLSDGTAITGATGTSYTFAPSGEGSYGFYCRVSGFGGYTQTDTASIVVEASGSHHVLTVGYLESSLLGTVYAWSWGFSNDSESPYGEILPRLSDTGDELAGLSTIEYIDDPSMGELAGLKLGGIAFGGAVKAGSVTLDIDGLSSINGQLVDVSDYFAPNQYGFIFSESDRAAVQSLFESSVGSNINVKIKYTPA